MFGIGFWEIVIVGVVGMLFCIGPIIAVVMLLSMSGGSHRREPDERGV